MHEYKSTDFLDSIRDLDGAEVGWLTEHATRFRNHFVEARPRLSEFFNELCILLSEDIQERPERTRDEVSQLERLMANAPELPEGADLDNGGGWGRPPAREV